MGNNIGSDPRFNDINSLLGPDNRFGAWDDGLRLEVNSPCIFAGDMVTIVWPPEQDITGLIRSDITDMGAYFAWKTRNGEDFDMKWHEDHLFGFDRIYENEFTRNYTEWMIDPEVRNRMRPDKTHISVCYKQTGLPSGIVAEARVNLIVNPGRPLNTFTARVANPLARKCYIKDCTSLVTQKQFTGKNIHELVIAAGNAPADASIIHETEEIIFESSDGTELDRLNVELYRLRRDINAWFYRVYDPDSKYDTRPISNLDFDQMQDAIDDIFLQGVVRVTLHGDMDLEVDYDLNNNGALDYYDVGEIYNVPGFTDDTRYLDPERTFLDESINLTIPCASAYYTRSRAYNWVVVADPLTGALPSAGSTTICVKVMGKLPHQTYITQTSGLKIGPQNELDPATEDISINKSISGVFLGDGVWRYTLIAPLQFNHPLTIQGGKMPGRSAVNGHTVFKMMRNVFNASGSANCPLEINSDSPSTFCHEFGHNVVFPYNRVGAHVYQISRLQHNLMNYMHNTHYDREYLRFRPIVKDKGGTPNISLDSDWIRQWNTMHVVW